MYTFSSDGFAFNFILLCSAEVYRWEIELKEFDAYEDASHFLLSTSLRNSQLFYARLDN